MWDLVLKHLPLNFEDFRQMGLVKDGINKRVEFAIENIWDICSIINSDREEGIPQDEDNILENLTNAGILDPDLGEKLKLTKGFRNIVRTPLR